MSLSVDIRKRLRDFTLDVRLEAGSETLGLLGASGCGKSMTLKCVAGVEKPDEGRIVLNGRTLFDSAARVNLPPQRRNVGYLFQQYALFPNMTVEENIAAGARQLPREERAGKVKSLIDRFRLEGLERSYPNRLSGGQQQRVALARILAGTPELILLDEPFTALDSHLKWQLELELMDTLKAFGGTTLFISHDRSEVRRTCDTVCVLADGKSEEKVTADALFAHPSTLAACRLIGCKNYSRIRILDGRTVEAVDWGVKLHCADAAVEGRWAAVRESAVRAAPEGSEDAFPCQVLRTVEDIGGDIVMLRTPSGAALRMETPPGAAAALHGDVSVTIRPEDVLLLKD